MGTPGWLLKLVIAFLEARKIILRHKGTSSEEESLPGGGPQGTKLGLFLFLILMNKAGYQPNQICTSIGYHMTKPKKKSIKKAQQKYVDDMTQCASLNLKETVVPDPKATKDLPKQLHERTGHILPVDKNPIQAEVNKLKAYARDNKMVINEAKTKLMLFNSAKNIDILPYIELTEGYPIEIVDEAKLLGLVKRSDLK